MEQKVFISRAGADAPFASEIGRVFEDAGYQVILQQWDFANRSFMERMHAALAEGARVVALLSPDYLRSDHCEAEWQSAIAHDPLNTKSRLVLLRVAECEPVGLLSSLAYWDLVPIRDNSELLRGILLDALREGRRKSAPGGAYWREPRTIIDLEAIRSVPSFSGREEELEAIAAALTGEGSVCAVHGLGGVGKSSIAREYAWRNRDRYAVVWWLAAQSEDGIVNGLLRLGALFTRGLDQLPDRRTAAQQVTRSMLSGFAKPVLLIFDNLEDERLLRTWHPRTGSRALATSRNAAWSADVCTIPLDIWPLETAAGYLRRESRRADLSGDEARAIAQTLGALPLAVSHAAAALRGMRMVSPEQYIARISEHLAQAPRNAEYPRSVFATFRTAIAAAEQQTPGAAALLCFAARFATDAIPGELFRQTVDLYPETLLPVLPDEPPALDLHAAVGEPMRVENALGALDQLSLLSFAAASQTFAVHRLVQLVARDLVSDGGLGWSECAAAVADAVFPQVEFGEIDFAARPQCERLLAHVRAALSAPSDDVESLPAARLAERCAVYLRERGDYDAAETLQKYALTVFEKAYGPDHSAVATSLYHLANVYWRQGRYRETEPLFTRAVATQERALGADHLDVAMSLNGLGVVCRDQGRYAEAASLHERALAIRERRLGADHTLVAQSLNNLGIVRFDQGRYAEAESLYGRALAALPPDDPSTSWIRDNLARLCRDLGRFEEAEQQYVRALAIREQTLGPDHPDVAFPLNNLAMLYRDQRHYAQAESLYQRALKIRSRVFGPDHPRMASTLNGLAVLYRDQGRYEEAAPIFARALAIREKALGPEHADVATSLDELARLYLEQKAYADAEPLFARALAIRQKALGPDHLDVATSLNDLAALNEALGNVSEARSLHARAQSIRAKALAPDRPVA